jgi:hypothetical protein
MSSILSSWPLVLVGVAFIERRLSLLILFTIFYILLLIFISISINVRRPFIPQRLGESDLKSATLTNHPRRPAVQCLKINNRSIWIQGSNLFDAN